MHALHFDFYSFSDFLHDHCEHHQESERCCTIAAQDFLGSVALSHAASKTVCHHTDDDCPTFCAFFLSCFGCMRNFINLSPHWLTDFSGFFFSAHFNCTRQCNRESYVWTRWKRKCITTTSLRRLIVMEIKIAEKLIFFSCFYNSLFCSLFRCRLDDARRLRK